MAQQNPYQQAMREAANAAWDRDWQRAAEMYQQALNAKSGDSQALAGLALAQLEAGRLPEALDTYKRVSEIVPGDTLPHEKIAEIHDAMGQSKAAAAKYAELGEMYLARKDMTRAITNWEQALARDRDLPQPHLRLAMVYARQEDRQEDALYEFLEVARLLQQYNRLDKAQESLERARAIDALNQDLRNAMDDFRRNVPIQVPERNVHQAAVAKGGTGQLLPLDTDEPAEEPHPPVEAAARMALGYLADQIWGGEMPQAAQAPLMQALDAHNIGEGEAALEAYQTALSAGMSDTALYYNIGMVSYIVGQYENAIASLQRVEDNPDFDIAANMLIGQAHLALGQLEQSAMRLLDALRRADQTINRYHDADGYMRMIGAVPTQFPEDQRELAEALVNVLDDGRWQQKLSNTLNGYAAQGKTSYVADMLEILVEGGKPEIADVMERINHFLARNMLAMAMEEAQYAVERAPDYLPAHRRVADVLNRQGRAEDAAAKLNLVATAYALRGNPDKAGDIYEEVTEIWPADLGARVRVIELMKEQGRVDEAMGHYAELAEQYYRMRADINTAFEIYEEARTYGNQNQAGPNAMVPIYKAMAKIEADRLNTNKAIEYYDEVRRLAPNDERNVLALVDLNFRSNRSGAAIGALDDYMNYCIANGLTDRIQTTLEAMVRRYPEEAALRQRLADVYRQGGNISDAVAQLDALGEMYLDAGNKAEAINVIRMIVNMNPPDVDGYAELLAQLESGS